MSNSNDACKKVNHDAREAAKRRVHDAAKAAKKRLHNKPRALPIFWDPVLKVFIEATPQGALCVYERKGRRRGDLIARSVPGNWHKLDPEFNTNPDLSVRFS
jgi:hypothetical protein